MVMTTALRLPVLSLFSGVEVSASYPHSETKDDLRREYTERLIASECCDGEYGLQALMSLFPREF